MAIVDGRTLLDAADAIGSVWVDEAGGNMSLTLSTGIFIEGTGSIAARTSKTTDGILFDAASTQNWAGNVFYLWINSTVAALLDTKANGGITVRFTGATVTDWFEVNVAGSDTYGGGFQMFVVDVDLASANPDATNGTPPATSAIQRVGAVFTSTVVAPGADDNIFVDSCWRLPANTPGIRVEGRNGSAPWTFQDIVDAADPGDPTKAWGTAARFVNGTISLNTPVRFGADDATQDDFSDGGEVIGWEDQPVRDGFYGFDTIAGSGQMDVTLGTKVGSGDSADGVNGVTVVSGGPRWFFISEDADQDSISLLGCAFQGSGPFDVAQTAVEIRSCVFSDCDTLTHNNGVTVVKCFFNAAPGPGPQVDLLDDPASTDFFENTFTNMKWWAIEISENGSITYNLRGLKFSGNGANRDVLLSHASGLITLAVVDSPNGISGDTPGVTNGASITVTTAGASDIRITAVALDNVNQTTPIETSNGANTVAGGDPLTAAVTPDNADNYLAAVYAADVFGTIDWSGSSAYVEEIDTQDIINGALTSGASKTGVTGAQTASADHSGTVLNAAITVVNVDEASAGAVTVVDPEWRPVDETLASTTHVFSYGAAHAVSPSSDLAVLVFVHTQDPTAVDTNVTSVSWGGTNMTEIREDFADDSGGGGEGLRTTVFRLIGSNLRKGTFTSENNVTIEILGVTEGSRVVIQRTDTGAELLNALAFVSDGQGAFKASVTFNYSSDTPVRMSAAASGKVTAAVAEDQSEGGPFTDETLEANDSRSAEGMTLVPTIAAPAIGDAYYIGHTEQFNRLDIDISTAGVGAYTIATEYWNGAWVAVAGEVDGTNDFKNAGTNRISWTLPGDQVARTVTNQPGSTALFYVRFRVTATGFTTDPVGNTVKLDVTLYERWEDVGTIISTGLAAKATWLPDLIAEFAS